MHTAKEAERNFLLSVSHELKTPLTAIRGYAEALEDGAFTAEEAAATIREEARRLERLVRDLLDLARMNRREFAIHREQIDLGDVGREAVRRYEAEARAGGVELDAIAPNGAPALGDPDRVLQVVSNLVENALRSTPPGGSVHVRAQPGVIEVVDTGVGLAPDDIPHAFERFYLHDRVGHPDGGRWSSGLGLAIVKELCERMGGLVTLESTLGEGTTFTVRLPRASACASAGAGPLGCALMARRDVLVLCYHGVAPGSLHGEVTPEAFRAQLNHLACAVTAGRRSPTPYSGSEPGRVAAITFDDGIASAVEHGLPDPR